MASSIEVTIQGKSFRLKTEHDPEYVRGLAEYVDRELNDMLEITQQAASDRVAIMGAIKIADKLFQLKKQTESNSSWIDRKVRALISASDTLLSE